MFFYLYNMRLFKKKDKRYNTQFDNYTDKYMDNFILLLFYMLIGVVGYLLYSLNNYLF